MIPTASVVVTATSGNAAAGRVMEGSDWTAGFDHASVIANKLMRSDGYDLRLRHTATGALTTFEVTSGLGTADCRLKFQLAANIPSTTTDYYTLEFGNLGWQATPFTSVVSFPSGAVMAISCAVAYPELPPGSFTLDTHYVNDTVELSYPAFAVSARKRQNQNARAFYNVNWGVINADEWYSIQSFEYRKRGGADSWPGPAWLDSAKTFRFASPISYSKSPVYSASCVIEEVLW